MVNIKGPKPCFLGPRVLNLGAYGLTSVTLISTSGKPAERWKEVASVTNPSFSGQYIHYTTYVLQPKGCVCSSEWSTLIG